MKRHERAKVSQWGPEHETDLAIKYLRNEGGAYRRPDRPFALVVSMNPPHTPYNQVPQRYVETYAGQTADDLINRPNVDRKKNSPGAKIARQHLKNYFAMVTGVDDQFGRILATLEREGLADDTIVVFTSDHGNCVGCHNMPTKNNHYEESMRVPFMIRWPERIPARHDDLLLATPDIAPTLLGLMGFRRAIPRPMQGRNWAPLFQGRPMRRPTSQLYFKAQPWSRAWGERGVRTHRHTLMIRKTPDRPTITVLHDNENDPYQLKNIADEQPQIATRLMKKELVPWLKKTRDPWLRM
jgi:arylsulfatase A-like enzyme